MYDIKMAKCLQIYNLDYGSYPALVGLGYLPMTSNLVMPIQLKLITNI